MLRSMLHWYRKGMRKIDGEGLIMMDNHMSEYTECHRIKSVIYLSVCRFFLFKQTKKLRGEVRLLLWTNGGQFSPDILNNP